MDWLQVAAIAGSTIGSCWWLAREHKFEIQQMRTETQQFRNDFQKEVKDFHARLCVLEEKYIHMMERILEKK